MVPLPPYGLRLLGAFQLIQAGEPITLERSRLEELIALLATRPGTPFTRAQIAYQFWPDSSEGQARTNARNLFYKLKQAWPDLGEAIALGNTHAVWRQDAAISVDVHHFEDLHAQAGQGHTVEERAHVLAEAIACYQGDFLPGCYADWALNKREQLRARYALVLDQLIDALLALRQIDKALDCAKQLRDHDPLHEAVYRRLMQIYALLGDRAAALRVYHDCASMLQKEFGAEPSSATLQRHAQLLQHPQGTEQPDEPPQTVQRPRLIGRHQAWQQLQHAWQKAQRGRAQCVILWGEAGIGKTRLAEELIDWVHRQDYSWASSRSYAAQGALPYAPITEWLRSPRVRPSLETVDDLWRVELVRLLPELQAGRPDLPPPGPLTETWQQQRFFQSIVQALQATPGPLLLHLDDMQWSDQETLTLLHFILYSARSHPLLIVGAVRSEDAGDKATLASLLAALRHNDQLTELHLAPLSLAEMTELAEQTANASIAPDIAEALYATSEGHPLFLIETVRNGLIEAPPANGVKAKSLSPRAGLAQIPPKIYSLLSARLGQLSPVAQQVASTAAVIGRAFTYQVLQAAMSLDELTLIDALDELWMRRIVREQEGDGYDFSHDRMREVAYQEISRARRRLCHRQVAAALASIHGADLDGIAGELAVHYAEAGDSALAYRYYDQAARVALAQYALAHAEALFDAALLHAPDDPEVRIELLQTQNTVFSLSLQFGRWRQNLDNQQALSASLTPSNLHLRLEMALDDSLYYSRIGDGGEAIAAARVAIALAQTINDKLALSHSYRALGQGYWMQAHMSHAGDAFSQSTQYAREAGDRAFESSGLALQAQTGMYSGMPAEPMFDLLARALGAAEVTGNKRQMADIHGKLGYCWMVLGMGDFDRAEQDYQRSLALGREIGDSGRDVVMLSSLGVLLTQKGNYRRALAVLDASFGDGELDPSYWRYWVTCHYRGAALMQMGCLDSARTDLINASEQLCQLGNGHYEVKARSDLGLLYHLAGDHRRAQAELAHTLGLTVGQGDLRLEALVSTRLGYVLEVSCQADKARRLYARGYTLHTQMGQHYYALNALAGTARLADLQGDEVTALAHARTIWDTIAGKSTDATIETARTLRTCYRILRKHGDPRAADIVEAARSQLRRRAGTIDDADQVAQFWQLADHRFFQEVVAKQPGFPV